jgi:tRNA (guanine37-N1)-methyltransferase
MRFEIVTIFPGFFTGFFENGILRRALAEGLVSVAVHDLRNFTHDRHRTVDDSPAGGGAGMVMRPEPWGEALEHVLLAGRADRDGAAGTAGTGAERGRAGEAGAADRDPVPTLIVPSPSGVPFTQAAARELATRPWLAFACGRYEGIDERVLDDAVTRMPVLPVSLGDYVLGGGEVAALVIVEAVARLLPGVLGNADSLVEESHEDGLLEYPVYTRPATWRGLDVPPVLMSGHHAQVRRWQRDQRLLRTARRRPDLVAALDPAELDRADLAVLAAEGWAPSPAGWVRTQAGPG